jgi:hypothetical protein
VRVAEALKVIQPETTTAASSRGLPPVVIAIERVWAIEAAAFSTGVEVFVVARVVVSRVEVHDRVTLSLWMPGSS